MTGERTLVVNILGDSASAERAFAKTGVAADAAAAQMGKAGKAVETTGTRIEATGKRISKVGSGLSKYVSLPLLGVGAAAVHMSLDFQKSMLLVETHTETSKKQVEKYKKAILEMSSSGKYTQGPNELAEAMYHIASDGYKGEKALLALKESADLAMLGQSNLAETTYAVVSAMKTGIKGTQDLHETIGILNGTMGAGDTKMGELVGALSTGVVPAAKAAGLELTDVGAALAFLTARGVPAQKAAYGLSMNFQQLIPYTEKAAKATERLGLRQHELAEVASKGPEGWLHALQDLERHLQGLDKYERTSTIEELFGGGRTSRGVLAQLQNLKDLEATYERLGVIAGKTDKNLRTARESEANQWHKEWAELQAALVELGNEVTPVLIPVLKEVGHDVGEVAHAFDELPDGVKHWIIALGLAAVALGPITKGVSGIVTLAGKATKAFKGMTAAEEAAAVAGGGAMTPMGVGGASRGFARTEQAAAAGWLGTERTTAQATLQRAGELSARERAIAAGGISEAAATRDALGLGMGSTRSAALASAAATGRSVAGALAKGMLTYGLGGVVVGQVVKEVGDSSTADEIGAAVQGAGVGAAIGSAIAPGIGIGIGAAIGGIGSFILEAIPDEGGELEAAGAKEARRFFNGFRKERESGRLQKMVEHGALGREGRRQGAGEIPGTEYGTTYREGGTGLRGLRAELRDKRQAAKATNQPREVIKAYSEQIAAVNRYINSVKGARATFAQTMTVMKGDVSLGMGAIDKDLTHGLLEAETAWGKGTKGWRTHTVEAMEGAAEAIKSGIHVGTINAEKGQRQINKLLARIHLLKGDDPFGLAKATATSFEEAGAITAAGTKKWEGQLAQMPKAARESSIDSTNEMLRAWAKGHPKLEKQIESLTRFEVTHFDATNKQLREGVKKGATGPVAEAFREAAEGVGGALSNIGTNTNDMLKALGLHDRVEFEALVFGPSRMPGTQLNKEGGGSRVAGNAKHHNYAGGGLTRVPGQGLEDTVGLRVNGTMSAVVAPGEDLMVVNRHQRGPLDYAVANTYGVPGMNGFFSEFDRPHYAAKGGEVKVAGPAGVAAVGHGALSKAAKAVNAYFEAHRPKEAPAAPSGPARGPAGTSTYMGVTMATWVKEALEFAAAHGSGNPQPTSGYRPGFDPHTASGGSEHAKTQYPGGAVDFGGMYDPPAYPKKMAVVNATRNFRYPLLAPIGFHDDGHASGTGHARGGSVVDAGPPGRKHGKFGKNFQKRAHQIWGAASSFFPAGATMPRTWATSSLGDRSHTSHFDDNSIASYIARDAAREILEEMPLGEETLIHEWAHAFQPKVNWKLRHGRSWEVEGGAEAFAHWAAPQIYGKLGTFYADPPMGYPGRVRKVIAQKGWPWIKHGQFALPTGKPGEPGTFAKGGIVGRTFNNAFKEATHSIWPKAAHWYHRSPRSRMPTTVIGPEPRNVNATTFTNRYGQSAVVLSPHSAAGVIGVGDEHGKATLLHEWTHVFQKSGLKRWEAEGGAVLLANLAARSIWGAGRWFPADDEYKGFAAKVARRPHDLDWVRNGQFGYARGGMPAFAKGGSITASSIKHSGTLSPEEWMFAMLLGGFPAKPGVLAQGTGTIKAESGFDASSQVRENEHEGGWALSDAFGPTSMKLEPIAASHAAFGEWQKDGGFWDAWGRYEQEQSGLAGGGAHAYGPEYLSLAEDVVKRWKGGEGRRSAGHGGGAAVHAVKPGLGHGVAVSVAGLKSTPLSPAATHLPKAIQHSLMAPGIKYGQKVALGEEALSEAKETESIGDDIAATRFLESLYEGYGKRIDKELKEVRAKLHKRMSPGQRKKLEGRLDALLSGKGEVSSSIRGLRGEMRETRASRREAAVQAAEEAAEQRKEREAEERATPRWNAEVALARAETTTGKADDIKALEELKAAAEKELAYVESTGNLEDIVTATQSLTAATENLKNAADAAFEEQSDGELALAELTETLSDDLEVLHTRLGFAEARLAAAEAEGNWAEIAKWAHEVKALNETIESDEGAEASTQLAEEIKTLREAVEEQNAMAKEQQGVSNATLLGALGDLLSGHLGPLINHQAQTAGAGKLGTV